MDARATSHNGYNYKGGPGNWLSDIGISQRAAWGPETGHLYVSGGSHAGHVFESGDSPTHRAVAHIRIPIFGGVPHRSRWTPADRLELIPIEDLDGAARRTAFAVIPPWHKPSYRDPEG